MKEKLKINQKDIDVEVMKKDKNEVSFSFEGKNFEFEVLERNQTKMVLRAQDGSLHTIDVSKVGESFLIQSKTGEATATGNERSKRKNTVHEGSLVSPMPGKIFKVLVTSGQKVVKGETLLIVEAMKMEHAIKSTKDGVVKKLLCNLGDLVAAGKLLVELE